MLQRYDERNAQILVNVNGHLVLRGEAGVSPFDPASRTATGSGRGAKLAETEDGSGSE